MWTQSISRLTDGTHTSELTSDFGPDCTGPKQKFYRQDLPARTRTYELNQGLAHQADHGSYEIVFEYLLFYRIHKIIIHNPQAAGYQIWTHLTWALTGYELSPKGPYPLFEKTVRVTSLVHNFLAPVDDIFFSTH